MVVLLIFHFLIVWPSWVADVNIFSCVRPSPTSILELFCENSQWLLTDDYFRKNALSQILLILNPKYASPKCLFIIVTIVQPNQAHQIKLRERKFLTQYLLIIRLKQVTTMTCFRYTGYGSLLFLVHQIKKNKTLRHFSSDIFTRILENLQKLPLEVFCKNRCC